MRCSKCGQEIPDGSMVCGYCGEKLSGEASTAPVTPEAGTAPEPAMTQEATQTAETSADQQVSPGVPPEIADTPGEKKKKSHLGRIALIVILALVVVLGVIGFIFRDVFANFYHRTFDSPEKYFRYVQNRRIDKAAEDIADAYESWIQSGKLFSQSPLRWRMLSRIFSNWRKKARIRISAGWTASRSICRTPCPRKG